MALNGNDSLSHTNGWAHKSAAIFHSQLSSWSCSSPKAFRATHYDALLLLFRLPSNTIHRSTTDFFLITCLRKKNNRSIVLCSFYDFIGMKYYKNINQYNLHDIDIKINKQHNTLYMLSK